MLQTVLLPRSKNRRFCRFALFDQHAMQNPKFNYQQEEFVFGRRICRRRRQCSAAAPVQISSTLPLCLTAFFLLFLLTNPLSLVDRNTTSVIINRVMLKRIRRAARKTKNQTDFFCDRAQSLFLLHCWTRVRIIDGGSRKRKKKGVTPPFSFFLRNF